MLEEITGDEINGSTDSRPVRPLRMDTAQLPDRLCVKLYGELDDASAPLLRDRVACFVSEPLGDLVIDLSDLTFVDSTGISLFVTLHKNLESKGQQLVLLRPTPMARRVMEITRLDSILRIEPISS
jgi:anti-sigma B factor antagonist